jgi:hypothetical protein
LLNDLIDSAKGRGEVIDVVDSNTLAHNLFSLYFNFQYLWLAADMPRLDRVNPTLRERLAVQLGVVRRR